MKRVRERMMEAENLKPKRVIVKTYQRASKASIALSEKTGNNKVNALLLKEPSTLSKPKPILEDASRIDSRLSIQFERLNEEDDNLPLSHQQSQSKTISCLTNGLPAEGVGVEGTVSLHNCQTLEGVDDSADDKHLAYNSPLNPARKTKAEESHHHSEVKDDTVATFKRQTNELAAAAGTLKDSETINAVAVKGPADERLTRSGDSAMKKPQESGAQANITAETGINNDEQDNIPLAQCSLKTSVTVAAKRPADRVVQSGDCTKKNLKAAGSQVKTIVEIEVNDDDEDNIPLAQIVVNDDKEDNIPLAQCSWKTLLTAAARPADKMVVQSCDFAAKKLNEADSHVKAAEEIEINNDEEDNILLVQCCGKTSSKIDVVAKKRASGNRVNHSGVSISKKLKEAAVQLNAATEMETDSDNEDDVLLTQHFKKTIDAMVKKRPVSEMAGKSGKSSKATKDAIVVVKASEVKMDIDDEDDITLAQYSRKISSIIDETAMLAQEVVKSGDSASKKLKEAIEQVDTAAETEMDDTDDDIPLAQHFSVVARLKRPVMAKKPSTTSKTTMAVKKVLNAKKTKVMKKNKNFKRSKRDAKIMKSAPGADGCQKWTTLEHNGLIFPPPYTPHGIKMLYNGNPVDLSSEEEEVATMFAVMRDTDYATKPKFLANFWNDWKKILRPGHVIKSLEGCDFMPIYQWYLAEKEKRKQMSSEEKKRLKEEKLKQEEQYTWALVDGVKEKVGNFRVEPPALFRGRGEHPKMGKLKRRIVPEDITINIGEDAPIPVCPVPGHRWKEIRHDNTVTWLAFWNDPINVKESKYVFLAPSSSLKGQSDKEKYEKARKLKDYICDIRKTYTKNFTSSDETTRQIAVATYLIDRLALRAGNEKDDDEADTVGCCSLKVEHVTLIPPRSLEFDFLGKDSIRYNNVVEVEAPVYNAIGDFKKSKSDGQDLFDKLDTTKLNAHLKEIMPGLTAKVFRTYNASITLDTLLINTFGHIVPEKVAAYNTANKEVAVLCNHQRSVSKTHGAQMERLETKMAELEALLQELRIDLEKAMKGEPPVNDADQNKKRNHNPEVIQKRIMQTTQKIEKMKLDMRLKDDLKTVALGTSKINYMDPRITVTWCKRHEVPIEKIFNKSLLARFAWAMDVDMEFRF